MILHLHSIHIHTPSYDDTLNERADISELSYLLPTKQGVQTLWGNGYGIFLLRSSSADFGFHITVIDGLVFLDYANIPPLGNTFLLNITPR